MGGLVYSNAYPANNTDNNTYTQIYDWDLYVVIFWISNGIPSECCDKQLHRL